MTATEPTPLQKRYLTFIAEFTDTHSYAPTVREIAHAFGVSTTAVFGNLKLMEQRGYIVRGGERARALTVLWTPDGDDGETEYDRLANLLKECLPHVPPALQQKIRTELVLWR